MSQTNNFIHLQFYQLRKILYTDKLHHHSQDLFCLCICIALLSTIFSCPVCANPITSVARVKVSEMKFSEKLSNPCTLIDGSNLQRSRLTQESRDSTRRTVINEMKAKAALLKDNAETILRTNVLNDCPTLVLPSVATIPSPEDISNSTPLEVLRSFYTSLLNHTAYVLFMSEQIKVYAHDHTCTKPGFYNNAKSLGSEMQSLMCALRYCTLTLEDDSDEENSFEDSTDQILNEELSDHSDCSKRQFRDCQTVRSTVTLLRELTSYLRNTVLDDDSES